MTIQEVREWICEIESIREDDEAAHSEEDSLREAVLEAIAAGEADDPRGLARAALATREIEFYRWCA